MPAKKVKGRKRHIVVDTQAQGFAVLPQRWIVERTFAWLGRHRPLSKDYEARPDTSEAWIYVAMVDRMLERLTASISRVFVHPLREINVVNFALRSWHLR